MATTRVAAIGRSASTIDRSTSGRAKSATVPNVTNTTGRTRSSSQGGGGRGGPPTPGDGAHFEALAAALEGYTVVTYDRRGTSRSPRPSGWSTTTVAEQADDAAHLIRGITSDPAVVYGTSNGAMVALELALRHPERVSTVLLHEMPLLSVLSEPDPVRHMLSELLGTSRMTGPAPRNSW